MNRRIVVIDGHPDSRTERYGHALVDVYVKGAEAAGHTVRRFALGALEFPLLRTKEEHDRGVVPAAIRPCQEAITWAEHIVLVYPLWLGAPPALVKGFLEQLLRPGFAYRIHGAGKVDKLLKGKSARVVVTMGMPAFAYRWYFGAHSLKNLKRNILGFCGIRPINVTLIGMIYGMSDAGRKRWLTQLHELGREGR